MTTVLISLLITAIIIAIAIEIISTSVHGKFISSKDLTKLLSNSDMFINPLNNKIISNFTDSFTYIAKTNSILSKYYISIQFGNHKRIYRWSKNTKTIDLLYKNLKVYELK